MTLIRDDEDAELPDVVRVAAQATLLLIKKYISLMNDCELYIIAIGMPCHQYLLSLRLLTIPSYVSGQKTEVV